MPTVRIVDSWKQWRNFGLQSGGTKILVGFLDIKKWRGPSPHSKNGGPVPPSPPEITPMAGSISARSEIQQVPARHDVPKGAKD
jgi:hypothetical protein